ncbi:hypothetical protein KXJ75_18710 [Aeromonas sanarellii]|nr:hypothetical protein KXJ75_18710 [Aeromonas sanarellii]
MSGWITFQSAKLARVDQFSVGVDNDACRELVEQLAEQQQARLAHDAWVTQQIDKAFEKIDSGSAVFIEHSAAMAMFEERKAKIR